MLPEEGRLLAAPTTDAAEAAYLSGTPAADSALRLHQRWTELIRDPDDPGNPIDGADSGYRPARHGKPLVIAFIRLELGSSWSRLNANTPPRPLLWTQLSAAVKGSGGPASRWTAGSR